MKAWPQQIKFLFDVDPVPWHRPEKRGRFSYKHPDDKRFQEELREIALKEMHHKKYNQTEKGVSVQLYFYLKRPKSVKRSLPSVRPDLDNYCKNVLDAVANKCVTVDDGQICDLFAKKIYTETNSYIEAIFTELWD